MINYYVDPGSGFIFTQGASFLWAAILGLLGTLFLFLRFFLNFFRKFIWFFFILLLILAIGGLIMPRNENRKKVIILGIDAMDPRITERLMQEGRFPNFSYLKAKGAYARLTTTTPSESAVAWTSFATGLNPASHGIFDFILRDPKNYSLSLSLNEISNISGRPKIHLRRHGETFWNILSKNKIPSYVYFCPNTFPPEALLGRMVSGMGVPDITGTMGKFSFYTTYKLSEEDKETRGRIIQVALKNNFMETKIYGFKLALGNSVSEKTIPLKISLYPDEKRILLKFCGKQVFLNESNWSSWQEITFNMNAFKKAYGIARFYLKSVEPYLELYLSPINLDPQRPLFPISYPAAYAGRLVKQIGPYYTQGMPHDTWALSEDKLDEKAFLEIADEILKERTKILDEGLKDFNGGAFFFYLDTLDAVQHMFWRYTDPQHPLYEADSAYKDTIFKYYEKIDRILGDILKKIGQDTTLIVLSDHGFSSFRKSVHLNRWLLEKGYLFLKKAANEGKEFFEDIDWSKTKAYALGFGGIYLNRIGREYYGIVSDSEAEALKQAIAQGLKQLTDPQTGEQAINNVYFQEDVFRGPYEKGAPDLFVGFNAGFRASWQTALGGVPPLLLEDNKKKWSGDHLIDSSLVPGVVFVNKKIELKEPAITDIVPLVLGLFGIAEPKVILRTK